MLKKKIGQRKNNNILITGMSFLWIHIRLSFAREFSRPGARRDDCILKLKLQRRTFLAPGSLPNMKTKKGRVYR